jgi:hypothetical protein
MIEICPDCKTLYDTDITDEVLRHKKKHRIIVNGIPVGYSKNDHVIWKEQDFQITVVNQTSPFTQRKRAQKTAIWACHDTDFDFASYHADEPVNDQKVQVFLLYCRKRIIGLVVTRLRSDISKAAWKKNRWSSIQKLPDNFTLRTLDMVWLVLRHRQNGLARLLISKATAFLGVDEQSIGWSVPFTASGEAMVRKLCPMYFYAVP